MADEDAILVGGPRDGEPFHAADTAVVELEIDGMIHRYIRTGQHRDGGGGQRVVYNYDGMVAPDGGEPGVENPRDRVTKFLANQDRAGHANG